MWPLEPGHCWTAGTHYQCHGVPWCHHLCHLHQGTPSDCQASKTGLILLISCPRPHDAWRMKSSPLDIPVLSSLPSSGTSLSKPR